jgi:hypothetical protein
MSSQDSGDDARFSETENIDPIQALVEGLSSTQLSGSGSGSAAVRVSAIPLPPHGSGGSAAPRRPWSLDLGVLFSADSMRVLFQRDSSSEYFLLPPAPSQPHPPLQAADVLRGACNIWTQYLHCTLLHVSSSTQTKQQLVTAITEFCSKYSETQEAVHTEVAQFVLTHLECTSERANGELFVANVEAPKQFLSFSQSLCRHLQESQGYESRMSSPHVTFAKKKYEKEPYTNWRSWLPHLSSKPVFMERSSVLQATQVFECSHETKLSKRMSSCFFLHVLTLCFHIRLYEANDETKPFNDPDYSNARNRKFLLKIPLTAGQPW